jgi:uncharacterized membrane protein
MILIFICCFVRHFNKNVFFLSTTLDFVIHDGQFASIHIKRSKGIDSYHWHQTEVSGQLFSHIMLG